MQNSIDMRLTRLSDIVHSVQTSASFQELLAKEGRVAFEHVCEGAQAFVVACIVQHHSSRSCWIVCRDVRQQESIFNGLLNWEIDASFFPQLELPAIEGAVPDPEIVAERLDVLRKIAENKRTILVLTLESLDEVVPAPDQLRREIVPLRKGVQLDRDALLERLAGGGYDRVSQVTSRGQYAVRGGILDVFSWHHALPTRIEFFGEEIDSLREF